MIAKRGMRKKKGATPEGFKINCIEGDTELRN